MTPLGLTIGFVDIAGYTALTEAHGDDSAAECASKFYDLAQRALVGKTRIVKRIGDAVMLVSTSPTDCVDTVLRLGEAARQEPGFPELRAGIQLGPAVERDGDYFGATVNLAARLSAHARAGETLCGASLADALRAAGHQARIVALGLVRLKNVEHPVATFSILLSQAVSPEGAEGGSIDPVCRMRVTTPSVMLIYDGCTQWFCSDACADRFRRDPSAFIPG